MSSLVKRQIKILYKSWETSMKCFADDIFRSVGKKSQLETTESRVEREFISQWAVSTNGRLPLKHTSTVVDQGLIYRSLV